MTDAGDEVWFEHGWVLLRYCDNESLTPRVNNPTQLVHQPDLPLAREMVVADAGHAQRRISRTGTPPRDPRRGGLFLVLCPTQSAPQAPSERAIRMLSYGLLLHRRHGAN